MYILFNLQLRLLVKSKLHFVKFNQSFILWQYLPYLFFVFSYLAHTLWIARFVILFLKLLFNLINQFEVNINIFPEFPPIKPTTIAVALFWIIWYILWFFDLKLFVN